jgi:WD40 repeat protein
MESSTSISTKHIFGVKSDVVNPIFHMDEHHLIYAAGHNVVVYTSDDRSMQFYPGLEGSLGITCMALCQKRKHLAVAERADKAIITVYDVTKARKRRTLVTTDTLSQEYVNLAFAPKEEKKFLLAMGGPPDWMLVYWQWDRQKVVATARVSTGDPVYSVSFNITDYKLGVIATGNRVLKGFKLADGVLKPQNPTINKKEAHLSSNYLCHAWLNDGKLVIGTDAGEVLLFDQNTEYKGYFSCGLDHWSALCILPYSNGFLVGGDEGRIVLFERNPEDLRMNYIRSPRNLCIASQPSARIKGMSLAPETEDMIVAVLDNSQIFSIYFTSDREEAEPLSYLFHTNIVTGLDVCIRKPLIVTCGLDNSVRIWNYLDRTLEVCKFFNEEPYSVAFHPSGFHIVVGFADKLRIMNIFADNIKGYKDIHIKACREIKFSHGGHLFAASNGHLIQVFNFYTGENPPHMQFKGHSGKVSALYWSDDDCSLISVGWDGAIYEWSLYSRAESNSNQIYFQKGIKFNDVLYAVDSKTGEGKSVFCTGTDKEIKEIQRGACVRHLETSVLMSRVAVTHSGKMLVATMGEAERPGSIRTYKFEPMDGEFIEYQAHSLPIERLRISYDDSFIFTVGQDGCLIIYEIKDRDHRSLKRDKDGVGLAFAEEILITKSEIEDLNKQIDHLQTTAKELESNNKLQFDMALQEKQHEIDRLKQDLKRESDQEKLKYEELIEAKRDMEQAYEDRMWNLKQQFEHEKKELEEQYQQRFNIEVARYSELSKEREFEAKEAAERIEKLRSEHTRLIAEKDEEFTKEMEKVRHLNDLLKKEMEEIQQEFEKKRLYLEDVNERQLLDLREQHSRDVTKIKFDNADASASLNMAKKREAELQEEKNKKAEEAKQMDDELEQQREQLKQQGEEIKTIKKELKERDKTIKDKDLRIEELNKKNQELEKFKFVLDYKIRELRRNIGPREDEIARLNEQTSEMEKELKHMNSVNESLGLLVDDLRMRQYGMKNEIKKQRTKLKDNYNRLTVFKEGIYDCVQFIQEEKKLKDAILKLYNRFVRSEGQVREPNANKEFERQADLMESNISGLRKKLKRKNEVHQQDLRRIMNQNNELIEEINGLRKELKYLHFLKRQMELLNKQPKRSAIEDQTKKEIEIQVEEIQVLRRKLAELESVRGVGDSFREDTLRQ